MYIMYILGTILFFHWECHHPNRSPSFFRGLGLVTRCWAEFWETLGRAVCTPKKDVKGL